MEGPFFVSSSGVGILLFFPHCPLGGLQRVDFEGGGQDFWLDMRSEVANAEFPLGGRCSVSFAEFLCLYLNYSVTTIASVDDRAEDACRVNLIVRYGHFMVSLNIVGGSFYQGLQRF